LESAARCANLEAAFTNARLAVLVNANCNVLPIGSGGCIVGTLFHRHGPAQALHQLADGDVQAILQGGERTLLRRFWGGYLAALDDGAGLKVMRDPSAALPCYVAQAAGHTLFASDAELLVEAGFTEVEIDWSGLAAHLHGSGLPTPVTALCGIGELLAGFALACPGGAEDQRAC
jgi:asparagine synthase (glutamine-hydrolysing)